MTVGPVEYVILQFPGNKFTGRVAPALGELVRNGTIRVLDLVFITKDADGTVCAVEYEDHEDLRGFQEIDGEVGGLIGTEDIDYVSEDMEPNSSVALLLWEDLWARPLLDALLEADGVLIEGARVPHDLIEPAMADLTAVN